MNNPQTFQQELHSMSLSDLMCIKRFVSDNYFEEDEDLKAWEPFYDAVIMELFSRIDLLKNKFEDDNKGS